jgi:hypothetical protein
MWSRGALLAITFVFVYGWKVTPTLDLILVASALLILAGTLRGELGRAVLDPVGAWVFLLFVWSIWVAAVFMPDDLFFVARNARAWINLAGAAFLAAMYRHVHGRAGASAAALDGIAACTTAHALLVMAMFASPELRDRIYAMTSAAEYANETTSIAEGFRITGLTYGLSQTSMLHAFGALVAFQRWLGGTAATGRVAWLAAFAIQAASIFLVGRSGLLFAVVGVAALLGRHALTRPPRRGRRGGVLAFLAVLLAGIGIAQSIGAFGGPGGDRESVAGKLGSYTVDHASEVLELLTTGESHTSRYVADGLFAPDTVRVTVLGGQGSGRGPGPYLESDSGYVKLWFGLGLVGCLVAVASYAAIGAVALRLGWHDVAAWLLVLYVAAMLLFNVKELALLTRNQWSVIALLYWLVRDAASARGTVAMRSGTPEAGRVSSGWVALR